MAYIFLKNKFRQSLPKIVKAIALLFLILVVVFFLFRNYYLEKAIAKISVKFQSKYNSLLHVKNAEFSGITGIELSGISITPIGKDTLLNIAFFSTSIRFWYALVGDIRIKELNLKDGFVQLIKKDNYRNFDNFLTAEKSDTSIQKNVGKSSERNYAKIVHRLISRLFAQIPNEVTIQNFAINIADENHKVSFELKSLTLIEKIFVSHLNVVSNKLKQDWQINGTASPSQQKADLTFMRLDSNTVKIPYVDERFNLNAGFENIQLKLNGFEFKNEQLKINGYASIRNLFINHKRISKKNLLIKEAEIEYTYLLGAHFISLDSITTITFNKIKFHPFIKYENSPDTIFYFGIKTEKTLAQDFINALPDALFGHIQGMQASGSFNYRLDFKFNTNKPQDMVFESTIVKDNLKITKYGEANLDKLNAEFNYTSYENGNAHRSFLVGISNPNFFPLDQISPYMKKCVLTTEDPSFMWHRGFVTEAFRQSIVKNIHTKKFTRGASTISMQLIKNVFLTREKTISRKLEEILLVYILENNHICPKERMFEVYLNIIEWGPNVYGIGEAAQFYFNKHPIDLTFPECIYLATIIPRPKGFMWRFEKNGILKDFAAVQSKYLTSLMFRRELILPEDTLNSNHSIKITGPALKLIIKNDSNVVDTILDSDELFFDSELSNEN